MNNILIGCDHAGFHLKNFLIDKLKNQYFINDFGCDDEQSVDYPDYAKMVSKSIKNEFGILICGSGIGMSIIANRFNNVRAALCHDILSAELSRQHNNANIICIGSKFLLNDNAYDIVTKFLTTEFSGEDRHIKRIKKLDL